jgi:hypothetical protein
LGICVASGSDEELHLGAAYRQQVLGIGVLDHIEKHPWCACQSCGSPFFGPVMLVLQLV